MTTALPSTTFGLDIATEDRPPPLLRGGALAIGSFDGVHKAHQALIAAAVRVGGALDAPPLALTFEPHPRSVLRPDAPIFRLLAATSRRTLLGIAGAKGIVEIAFTRDLAGLPPETFVQSVLAERLEAKAVIVGEGFRFGSRRAGDVDLLRALGMEFGFEVEVLPVVTDAAGQTISSGRVREALRDGEIAIANAILGYRWFVVGTVASGDKRGRELGYPTANIHPEPAIDLRHGVYAVTARWDGGRPLPAIASYGVRPTFGGAEPILEVHLFDRSDDLYGRELTVSFLEWLRPEESFPSTEALILQMDADSRRARAILAASDAGSPIDQALVAAG